MSWVNLDTALARLTGMAEQANLAARTVVEGSAAIAERAIKANFDGSHSKGQPHTGGNKPNIVSSTLRRSIRASDVEGVGFGEWRASVGPTTVYGRRIELGYPGGPGVGHAHTRAFPYVRPGADTARAPIAAYRLTVFGRIGRS